MALAPALGLPCRVLGFCEAAWLSDAMLDIAAISLRRSAARCTQAQRVARRFGLGCPARGGTRMKGKSGVRAPG